MQVNVREARAQFSTLLERAHAGEEIILAKAGKPYARMLSLAPLPRLVSGRCLCIDDVASFEPLSDDELKAWD